VTDLTTLVFDVLGTLLDEDAGLLQAAGEALPDGSTASPDALFADWVRRTAAAMEQVIQGEAPFVTIDELQGRALADALATHGVQLPPDELDRLARAGHRLAPFPDTVAAFERLASAQVMVGLTNAGLSQAMDMSASGGLRWTTLVSAETVGAYKPDPRMYAYVVDRLEVDPRRSLFVAAHPWDLDAAAQHGFHTAYVDRPGSDAVQLETYSDRYDFVVPDLAGLADILAPAV
jgi:2-haloacid dehalogenase